MTTTINASTSSGLVNTADTSGILQLQTASTVAVTIDASQNVGIGTSSPANKLEVTGDIKINAAANGTRNLYFGPAGGNYAKIVYDDSAGTMALGTMYAYPTIFNTNNTERMRVTSDGSLCIGQSTVTSTPTVGYCLVSGSGPGIAIGHASGTPSGYYYASFSYNGNLIGSIQQNGTTATSYVTSSDYRLKENVAPMVNALDKVFLLKPCTYTWKSDGTNGQGFIAHELQEIVPEAVTGEKDAINKDGTIRPQGIDTSFLVATLTAAIQELNAKFEEYKASHP